MPDVEGRHPVRRLRRHRRLMLLSAQVCVKRCRRIPPPGRKSSTTRNQRITDSDYPDGTGAPRLTPADSEASMVNTRTARRALVLVLAVPFALFGYNIFPVAAATPTCGGSAVTKVVTSHSPHI